MELFSIVPVFIGFIFVVVIGGILFAAVKGVSQWSYNNSQPVEAMPAKVVAKRTATSGGAGDTSVSTWYYVTFETEGGDRREFSVGGREYGLLAEGDRGMLSHQGTRYKGFQRQRG